MNIAIYVSCVQHDATKKELETAKVKIGQKAKATEEHFQNVLMKKDDEIHRLHDEMKGLKPIAERYRGLFAEHKVLELKFEAMQSANQTFEHLVHEMKGEKAVVDSRLKELTMVVDQVTGENKDLRQKIEVCCLYLVTYSPSHSSTYTRI